MFFLLNNHDTSTSPHPPFYRLVEFRLVSFGIFPYNIWVSLAFGSLANISGVKNRESHSCALGCAKHPKRELLAGNVSMCKNTRHVQVTGFQIGFPFGATPTSTSPPAGCDWINLFPFCSLFHLWDLTHIFTQPPFWILMALTMSCQKNRETHENKREHLSPDPSSELAAIPNCLLIPFPVCIGFPSVNHSFTISLPW